MKFYDLSGMPNAEPNQELLRFPRKEIILTGKRIICKKDNASYKLERIYQPRQYPLVKQKKKV